MISDFLETNTNSDEEFIPFLKTPEEFRDFSSLLSDLDGREGLRLAMIANQNSSILKAFGATPYLRGISGITISETECLESCFYLTGDTMLDTQYSSHYFFLAAQSQS